MFSKFVLSRLQLLFFGNDELLVGRVIGFDLIEPLKFKLDLLCGCLGAASERQFLPLQSRKFRFEFLQSCALKLNGRFVSGDRLASAGILALHIAQLIVQSGQFGIERGFALLDRGLSFIQHGQPSTGDNQLFFECFSLGGQMSVVVRRQTEPPLLERRGNIVVLRGLGGLAAGGIELRFDFVDDVGQSFEILADSFELFLGLDLAGLESADSRGFFKDRAAACRIPLQDLINPALFDDTVGGGTRSRSQKQILDIFQTSGSPIEQIFGIAVAPDSASDLDLLHVQWQLTLRVIEGQRGLGESAGFATG